MTDTISGAPPGLRAGSFTVRPAGPGTGFSTRNPLGMTAAGDQTRRIILAGRYTGTTPGGGHRFETGGAVHPRDFGITRPAIKKPVTIQITAELIPA
jgi:hypothetical protein